jgi:hypothetical protein
MRPRVLGFLPALVALAVLGPLLLPAGAAAQANETTDILTGIVVGANGQPLAGVTIEATSLETQVIRTAVTDARGRYVILFPSGGGQFRMLARLVGFAPQAMVLQRHADEDRLVWDVQLQEAALLLDPITVTGEVMRAVRAPDLTTPGSTQRTFTPDLLATLPLDASDMALLAALVPGALVIDATDSTDAAYSVAGQRPDANQLTVDGMSFGSGQLPQEGMRNTRVVTSTYDVSRGRFSGGLMASTSRSGSNAVQGSLNYSLRDHNLAVEGDSATPFTSGFTQHAIGGGVGGPLIHNRLFSYFSGQLRLRSDPQPSLTSATPADLLRLGVSPDSVTRFLTIVDSLGAAPRSRFDGRRANNSFSGMLRVDYLLTPNHTLMLRGDLRDQGQDPTRLGPSALPETGGESESGGGGVMAGLSSRIGGRVINEGRVYASTSTRGTTPYWTMPQGRVQVASQLPDGAVGITTLLMGGSAGMPSNSVTRSLEVSDELSWLPGAVRHRLKVGALFHADRTEDRTSTNQTGTFVYNSLADFAADAPAQFRRVLDPSQRLSTAAELAVYGGDVWLPSRSFQLNYGLRLERGVVQHAPPYNAGLDSSLGVRTDRVPSELDLSPRAGFTWMIGGRPGAQPLFIVRGGAGKFRSPLPLGLVSQAQSSTGLSDAESILECVGPAVPRPDWGEYQSDTAMIPAGCTGPSPGVEARAPAAAVFAPDFGAPKAWRTSLGVQRNLTTLLRLSVDLSYARGFSQYGFRDLNLNTTGGFTLSNEADRRVFVDPTSVVPETGAITSRASRIDSTYAQVLEMSSDLLSDTKQLTVTLGGVTRRGVVLQTSYTLSRVRDQSSQSVRFGSGRLGGNSTSGNPNVPEWGRSSLERRHAFLATVSYPFGASLDVTAIGQLRSGAPFTPMVAADINGDGVANDQAFVFAPPDLTGMDQLLSTAPAGVRRCLERQAGTIAARNSCLGPWEGSFDLQVNFRPAFWGLRGRLTASLTTVNLLHGIDQLLHGSGGLKGWGMQVRPDDNLLFVTGFDSTTRQYQYAVNQRFGASSAQGTAFRQPFQVGIQVRMTLGPDRQRDALAALRGGGRGMGGGGFGGGFGGGMGPGGRPGGAGGRLAPADFRERVRSLLVNPVAIVLERADSLALTPPQVERLTALRDSLNAVNDSLAATLEQEIEQIGAGDPRALLQAIRPRMQQAQENARKSLEAVRGVLTPEQWSKLPERLRNPRQPGQNRRPPGGV